MEEAERERRSGAAAGEAGGGPGVKRRLQQEQQIKEMLQAAHAVAACAQLRVWARCQGSDGEGAGNVPAKSLIMVLLMGGLYKRSADCAATSEGWGRRP